MGKQNDRQLSVGNLLGILGLVVGLVGVGSSYYFYQISRSEREPLFLTDSDRTIIIESNSIKDSPIKVVRENGTSIDGDISSIRFYFWNNGRQSVRSSDILKPLTLSFDDNKVEVLSFKILRSSRPDIVQPTLKRDSSNPSRRVQMGFSILETNDGFTGQIIYAGPRETELNISGAIEGVRDIKTGFGLSDRGFWQLYATRIAIGGLILVGFIGLLLLGSLGIMFIGFLKSIKEENADKSGRIQAAKYHMANAALLSVQSIGVLLALCLVAGVVYAVFSMPSQGTKSFTIETVANAIPASIRP